MSFKLPRIQCHELIRALKRAGFVEKDQKGRHLHLKRNSDNKRVTIPMHKRRDVPTGTLRAILRDADISIEEFRKLL
jgi:predicted RNA binding protein YcfA (HicA-like mRNA interferase family)